MAAKDKFLVVQAQKINSSNSKRLLDVVVSVFFLLFVFSWLYPIIAICIKLETKGLALFVQDRIGMNGKVFKCYKFRTLQSNAKSLDKDSLPLSYTTPATKVGLFLRKYNLDELPQLINVLKGEMSLVGPRPHAISFHNQYATYIKNIDERLLVKPGITGLAQVKGFRGDVENEAENKIQITKRIEQDIYYIQHWSFSLDVKIIQQTIFK